MKDKSCTNGDSGLGLAVMKSPVEKMQGEILATKEIDRLSFDLKIKQG